MRRRKSEDLVWVTTPFGTAQMFVADAIPVLQGRRPPRWRRSLICLALVLAFGAGWSTRDHIQARGMEVAGR